MGLGPGLQKAQLGTDRQADMPCHFQQSAEGDSGSQRYRVGSGRSCKDQVPQRSRHDQGAGAQENK